MWKVDTKSDQSEMSDKRDKEMSQLIALRWLQNLQLFHS